MSATLMTPKGEIIFPAELREKYGFDDWILMSIVDMGDGSFLLKPKESKFAESTQEIRKTLEENGVTLDDLLLTLREERKKLFQERYGNIVPPTE